MKLNHLKDNELLDQTKKLVQSEREILTKVLHHLQEVSKRKLFCDLGYQSLFEYAVKELKYSEGQAGRRIQAMRLLEEIPELEGKIEKGVLNLTNVSQAQNHFREQKKTEQAYTRLEKIVFLAKLENKSTREAQQVIERESPKFELDLHGEEMRFIMSKNLNAQFLELKSLLGHAGAQMTMTSLIEFMAEKTVEVLRAKKFGKKRTQQKPLLAESSNKITTERVFKNTLKTPTNSLPLKTPALELQRNTRVIPRTVRYQVWQRDGGRCVNCQNQINLNFDHIEPVSLGGQSTLENLRILCFHCNQRRSIKSFGSRKFEKRNQ